MKRRLIVVLGDQLDLEAPLLKKADPKQDIVWMAEVSYESTKVWSHQSRIALFLSAMRHFRDSLRKRGFEVRYHELSSEGARFKDLLMRELQPDRYERVCLTEPGEYSVRQEFEEVCSKRSLPLEIFEDESFLISLDEFRAYANVRKQLRMEFFYRMMRLKHGVLIKPGMKEPMGGRWNFDASNRTSFGKAGPDPSLSRPLVFERDSITKEVLSLVAQRFGDHPGELSEFNWPVTRKDALKALKHFCEHHLAYFGRYQDAMWTDEPFLHHSLLSAALNLKLLRPLEVIHAAVETFRHKRASLESVEGFVRQILGWREYVRGIYHLYMPGYLQRNTLGAQLPLPEFYWNGQVTMNCLKQSIGQTLRYGYAHHIQRLMVLGLYNLLLGVDPKQVHAWFLAVYVDAVEWVELPNTLGMSQFADGAVMASKPYIATGKYIRRMSNYCQGCPFDPNISVGSRACPFTTLYWDFVDRHRALLSKNPRISMQVRNWERLSKEKQAQVRRQAQQIKASGGSRPLDLA